jgi:hypothetical protein
MEVKIDPRTPPDERLRRVLAGLVGALVFFGFAYWLYAWLNPILEARRDWLREMQGFLFTVVPLATAAGAGLGWWLGRPRQR